MESFTGRASSSSSSFPYSPSSSVVNLLDPSAQEFYPAQFPFSGPQIYYPFPPTAISTIPAVPTISHYVQPLHAAADDDSAAAASSRAVVLSLVPRHLSEHAIARSMSAFGGVRSVDASLLPSDGLATVHFYDLRSAQVAVAEVRQQHMRYQSLLGQQLYGLLPPPDQLLSGSGRGLIDGQPVWAQFAARGLDVLNQGSLSVTLSDPAALSSDAVQDIFKAFGALKEVRELATRPQQRRIVEYFDVRDAARALNELDGKDIGGGVRLFIEFHRPAGSAPSYPRHHDRHQRRPSGPLPPRFARGSCGGGAGRGEGVVLLRRSEAEVVNVSRNGNNSSGRSKGKGIKASRNSNSYFPPSLPSPSSSSSSSSTSTRQQHQQGGKKGWKNQWKGGRGSSSSNVVDDNKKNIKNKSALRCSKSSQFEFKEADDDDDHGHLMLESGSSSSSSSCRRDSRTTVMIKNIPNKYSQKLLLNMLDNHCIHCNEQIGEGEPLSAYDFVYLPIDFNNKCNVGYGFVNLTSPEAAVRLYKAFHMQPWEVFNSRKICQVSYGRLQGLEALKEHFKNSRFPCDNDEYLPVAFSPPRDGKELTGPVAIGHRGPPAGPAVEMGGASSTTASTQAPSSDHEEDADVYSAEGGSGASYSDQLAIGALKLTSSSS